MRGSVSERILRLALAFAFVPGESFFSGEAAKNTMRINYTNSTLEQIDEGMQRLARAIERYSI